MCMRRFKKTFCKKLCRKLEWEAKKGSFKMGQTENRPSQREGLFKKSKMPLRICSAAAFYSNGKP